MSGQGNKRLTFTVDGHRYAVRGATQSEREAKKKRKIRELRAAGHANLSTIATIAEWADVWLARYKRGTVGEAQYKDLRSVLEAQIKPGLGAIRIDDISDEQLRRFFDERSGYSASHGRRIAQTLDQMFKKALRAGLCERNPMDGFDLPQFKKNGHVRAISDELRAVVVRTARGHVAGPYVLTLLYTGLRPGEAAALRWADVDFDRRYIFVRQARKAGVSRVGDPKSAAGVRAVPIAEDLLPVLADLRALRADEPADHVVFTMQRSDRPLTSSAERRLWASFWRAAGYEKPPVRKYALRHTFVTDGQRAGVPINVMREMAGHSDIKTTAMIYTDQSFEATEAARAALDALHRSKTQK